MDGSKQEFKGYIKPLLTVVNRDQQLRANQTRYHMYYML